MAMQSKEYRIIKSILRNRPVYTVRACTVDNTTGEIIGYDSNSAIMGVSPSHLMDLLKELPSRLKHNRVVDEKLLKEHLNADEVPLKLPLTGMLPISPVYTHKDVASFKPENAQEDAILDMYYTSLKAIQNISKMNREEDNELITGIYETFKEELGETFFSFKTN